MPLLKYTGRVALPALVVSLVALVAFVALVALVAKAIVKPSLVLPPAVIFN